MAEEKLFEGEIYEENKIGSEAIKNILIEKYPDTLGLALCFSKNLTAGQLAFLSDHNKIFSSDLARYLSATLFIDSDPNINTY